MKKIITCLTVIMLVAVFAVAANAQVKKSAASKALQMQAASGTGSAAKSGGNCLSPKAVIGMGDYSSFGVGVEYSMPFTPQVDGMFEATYMLPKNSVSAITVAGNAIYNFEKQPGMPGTMYAGGGLLYQMLSGFTGTTPTGLGFQILGGMNFPISESGVCFVQAKYASVSYTISVNTGWGTFSTSASNSGLILEGGYRMYM